MHLLSILPLFIYFMNWPRSAIFVSFRVHDHFWSVDVIVAYFIVYVILSNKDGKLKQYFQRKTMSPKLQIESASMLTVLYCVTMIQAEIHQLFQWRA